MIIIGVYSVFSLALQWYVAERKTVYIMHWAALGQLFGSASCILCGTGLVDTWLNMQFLHIFWCEESALLLLKRWYERTGGQIWFINITSGIMTLIKLLLTALAFTFVFANSMATVEVLGDPHHLNATTGFTVEKESKNLWNIVNAFYYTWVTISTVGYGDISPQSYIGRTLAIIFIVYGLYYFAYVTTEIYENFEREQRGHGQVYLDVADSHVIVAGGADVETIEGFVVEFLNDDYRPKNNNYTVTLLQENRRSVDLADLMVAKQGLLRYIEGNAFSEDDRARSRLHDAKAVFFVPSLSSTGTEALSEDRSNVLGVIALEARKQMEPDEHHPHTYIMMTFPDYLPELIGSGFNVDHVVIVNEIKWNLMYSSLMVPGLSTLMLNLTLCNSSIEEEIAELFTPGSPEYEEHKKRFPKWALEYSSGSAREMYHVAIPSKFAGVDFSTVAKTIFEEHGVVLFGLDPPGDSRVIINPNSMKCPSVCHGFVIAESSNQIESIGMAVVAATKVPKKRRLSRSTISPMDQIKPTKSRRASMVAGTDMEHFLDNPACYFVADKQKELHDRAAIRMKDFVQKHGFDEANEDEPQVQACRPPPEIQDHLIITAADVSQLSGLREVVLRRCQHYAASPSSWNAEGGPMKIVVTTPQELKFWPREVSNMMYLYGPESDFTLDLYYVQADLMNQIGRARCVLDMCKAVLVLENTSAGEIGDVDEAINRNSDAFTVFLATRIEAALDRAADAREKKGLPRHAQVISELIHKTSVNFLQSARNPDGYLTESNCIMARRTAAGRLFSESLLIGVLTKVFYSPTVIAALRSLLAGNPEYDPFDHEPSVELRHGTNDAQVTQIMCHDKVLWDGQEKDLTQETVTYKQLGTAVFDLGMVPMGLYRMPHGGKRHGRSPTGELLGGDQLDVEFFDVMPYVFTSPPHDEIVHQGDAVFAVLPDHVTGRSGGTS